jgi:peptidoglycan/xylan/chitin deacetylase (PgdA/CDA1 family)
MKPGPTGPFPYSPINRRPPLRWPNGKRLAVWIIPNIECFRLDHALPTGATGGGAIPNVPSWAQRDYGARVGVFRIMYVLTKHGAKGTVALNSMVCDAYPQIIEDCGKLGWELMGHNITNTRKLNALDPGDEEKAVIEQTLDRITEASGQRPRGWLGAGLQETWNTVDYLAEAGLTYVSDWVNDDQPYRMNLESGRTILSVPYSTDVNDIPAFEYHHMMPDDFDTMVRRQFDVLYEEGKESGRVMGIALHPYLIGTPWRIRALDSALSYIARHDGVWFATGSEIADAYLKATS